MEKTNLNNMIFGRNAVREALLSGRRPDTLYISDSARTDSRVREIVYLAKEVGAVVKEVPRRKLDEMAAASEDGAGLTHGGFAASFPVAVYASLEEILAVSAEKGKPPFIIIADGIEDPHNLGAIIRTAEAAGADGVIIPQRRSAGLSSTVFAASAGAAAWLKICRVVNLNDTISALKKLGMWTYGADVNGKPYTETDFSGSGGCVLVIGSEGGGISRLVKENCDFLVSVPMLGKVNSLNASVSAGILMYEIVKTRR